MRHYDWDAAAQNHVKKLRACAEQYPRFERDFVPRLNTVLFDRHREALCLGRDKTLNEARIQPHRDLDLDVLVTVQTFSSQENLWLTSKDGAVAVDNGGTLLRDIRPLHFKLYLLQEDRFGLLVPRDHEVWEPGDDVICVTGSTNAPAHRYSGAISTPEDMPNIITNHAPLLDSETFSSLNTFAIISPQDSTLNSFQELALSWAPLYNTAIASEISASPERLSPIATHNIDAFPENDYLTSEQFCNPADLMIDHCRGRRAASTAETDIEPHLIPNWRIYQDDTHPKDSTHKDSELTSPGYVDSLEQDPDGMHPSQQSSLRVTAASIPDDHELTIEDMLHNKYRTAIMSHVENLVREDRECASRSRTNIRAAWLTPSTRWAKVWSPPDGSLPGGRAHGRDDAEVMYYSAPDRGHACGQTCGNVDPRAGCIRGRRRIESALYLDGSSTTLLPDTEIFVYWKVW